MKHFLLKALILAVAAAALSSTLFAQSPTDSHDARAQTIANDLLAKMTIEEKASLCHKGSTNESVDGIPRLGIPSFRFCGASCGIYPEVQDSGQYLPRYAANDPTDYATCLPQETALAATWDVSEAAAFGDVLGAEGRDRNFDFLLGGTVNILRTPLNGRNFEYMGEDPYLVSKLIVPLVRGIQSNDVAACVKHFALNNQENDRRKINVEVDERTLREIYLPAFEAAVREGGVYTVMSAYNKFRGQHCSENPYLLTDILKKEWSFQGFIQSDWDSVHGVVHPAMAGLDMEVNSVSPNKLNWGNDRLAAAVKSGQVPEAVLDDKVRRILYVMAKIHKIGGGERKPGSRNTPEHQKVAFNIASDSIVLLKNDSGVLPLAPSSLKKVLVVGDLANRKHCEEGGSFRGKPPYEITPLEGIKKVLGDKVVVDFAPIPGSALSPVPASCLTTGDGGVNCWHGEFFNNATLSGTPAATHSDTILDFDWKGGKPLPEINATNFSARWTATLRAPATGTYRFGLSSDDGSRLFVNDTLVVDHWRMGPAVVKFGSIHLDAGKEYNIRVEYFQLESQSSFSLRWAPPSTTSSIPSIFKKAKSYDAVLVFIGDSHSEETEGSDLPDLKMPPGQDEAVEQLLSVAPNTIIVNHSGTPLEMPWIKKATTVVQTWFDGQEAGNALAAVLFGKVNPSGKLPFTMPVQLSDSPAHALGKYDHLIGDYAEGMLVGYRWFDAKGIEPMFPFGYGLSYTTFQYGKEAVLADNLRTSGSLTVRLPVTNSGSRAGAEVVELYLHAAAPSLPSPPQSLKGFQKLFLKPGETRMAQFTLTPRDFSYWDVKSNGWKVDPGTYEIRIGSSSRDIRVKTSVLIAE